jgi:predicted nucleic acid-binding protein
MRILIDTNILLRSADPGHAQHRASMDAVDLLRRRGHELVVVPQILYEFWSVCTRPVEQNGLGLPVADAWAELKAVQELFRLYRDERAIYPAWEQLVVTLGVKGKQGHDARLVAAMQRHAIGHLLTFNANDFSRYSMITVLTPTDILGGKSIA